MFPLARDLRDVMAVANEEGIVRLYNTESQREPILKGTIYFKEAVTLTFDSYLTFCVKVAGCFDTAVALNSLEYLLVIGLAITCQIWLKICSFCFL